MLEVLPGKHLLSLLAPVLGFGHTSELTGLVVRALRADSVGDEEPLANLETKLEVALEQHLPARKIPDAAEASGLSHTVAGGADSGNG